MSLNDFSFQNKKPQPENVKGVREDITKILSTTKVSELKLKDEAVILDASTDPKKAIEILVKNRVRAAPVIDNNDFIGVLDLRDTLKYVLLSHDSFYSNDNDNDDQKINDKHAMEYLLGDHNNDWHSQTLNNLCKHRPFRVVSKTDTLLQLCSIFALGSHVVGVINNDKKLIGVVTQGYFFQQISFLWIFNHSCSLNKLFELSYIISPIKSVNRNIKAIEAFKIMNTSNLSGLAVINDNGVLIHNTSATDIKLWLLKGNQSLNDSIEIFLINIRNLSLTERYPITVCGLNDPLKRAIQKLQATKYHRLWIVDKDTKPIGVLALTDVFKFIVATNENNNNNNKQENQNENEQKSE
eukprot:118751_1